MFNTSDNATPAERRKVWLLCRAMLRGYEAQIYQYEVGLLDDDEWINLKRVILETADFPGFAKLWPTLSGVVSDQLREIIEERELN